MCWRRLCTSTAKRAVRKLPPINLRDLLDFKTDRAPVVLDEVESITELRKRLVAPGMVTVALDPGAYTGPTRTNTRRLMGGSPAKVSRGGGGAVRVSV